MSLPYLLNRVSDRLLTISFSLINFVQDQQRTRMLVCKKELFSSPCGSCSKQDITRGSSLCAWCFSALWLWEGHMGRLWPCCSHTQRNMCIYRYVSEVWSSHSGDAAQLKVMIRMSSTVQSFQPCQMHFIFSTYPNAGHSNTFFLNFCNYLHVPAESYEFSLLTPCECKIAVTHWTACTVDQDQISLTMTKL